MNTKTIAQKLFVILGIFMMTISSSLAGNLNIDDEFGDIDPGDDYYGPSPCDWWEPGCEEETYDCDWWDWDCNEETYHPSNPYCGDNNVNQYWEECDDGNSNSYDSCDHCSLSYCGDGIKQNPNGYGGYEQCDDGNFMNDDGCSSACKIEVCEPTCGNGKLEAGEQCDDGNNYNGDGCDKYCKIEVCHPVCGNGKVEEGENCDDGNQNNNDQCSNLCGKTFCGDGTKQNPNGNGQNEQCDDGNFNNGDSCSDLCKNTFCGDGIQQAGEDCDDGNNVDGDLCSATCKKQECTCDSDCDDGLFCNGEEKCDLKTYTCKKAAPVDCSANNIAGINTCTYTPDGNKFTKDFRQQFISTCNEQTNSCTTGSTTITHSCDTSCGADPECQGQNPNACDFCDSNCQAYQCMKDSDCDDKLFCNGEEYCELSTHTCKSKGPVQCNDGKYCNGQETCNEQTDSCQQGMPIACDNGKFCDGMEVCDEGSDSCKSTSPVSCPIGYACSESKDVCELTLFAAHIEATPLQGVAILDVDATAHITGGVAPFKIEWDLDEDGDIDSTKEKNKLRFEEEGSYTLFMRVTSADGRVSEDYETITVHKENDRHNILHINHISFDKEQYEPGDKVRAFLNFENMAWDKIDDARVAIMVKELGIRSNWIKPATINLNEESSKMLSFVLPADSPSGEYQVQFIIDIDGDRRIKYRPITVI